MAEENTTNSSPPSSEEPVSFLSELSAQEKSDLELQLDAFLCRHASHHRPIALVTSGGTATDLEINSVRCLENFSTGLRGAISVEEFLKRGYAVVHLWRSGSSSPYGRVLSQSIGLAQANQGITMASLGKLFAGDQEEETEDQLVQSVLDEQDLWMTDPTPDATSTTTTTEHRKKTKSKPLGLELHRRLGNSTRIQSALKERSIVLQEGRLLTIAFRSVEEYLAKLQLSAQALRDSQSLAIFYLAAAVSDFYIPKSERAQHKIQSHDVEGGLTLKLHPVPKALGLLRSEWAPHAFVCSFKLETEKAILRQKAERAVQKYKCHMVIGNLLQTRHDQVWVLAPEERSSPDGEATVDVTKWPLQEIQRPRASESDALETLLMEFVIQSHFEYISWSFNGNFHSSGTEAVIRAHQELEKKKKRVEQEIFWKKIQKTALEWVGVGVGAVLSYAVSSALRTRMHS
jgi:phosphopantothenate-cysteine ligase